MNGQSLGVIHRNSGVPKVMQQTTVLSSSISCASRTRKSWISPRGTARKRWKSWPRNTAPRQNQINGTRANNLTDNTVIMILSESFSDPTRVPGIALAEDPMPNIRALKEQPPPV